MSLIIRIKDDPLFIWEKRAASRQEKEKMEYYFGERSLGANSSFFVDQTFFSRITRTVHLIGLRELALFVALLFDLLIWIGRKIAAFIHFPSLEHPQKIFLEELGAPEHVLRQNRIIVQFDLWTVRQRYRKVLEYQINPDL